MTRIVHLSDVHLGSNDSHLETLACLEVSIRQKLAETGKRADLLVVTGDVFDSATMEPTAALEHFDRFHAHLVRAVGDGVPIVVLPGNHDRRELGVLGPDSRGLFFELASHAPHGVQVVDRGANSLVSRVPAPGVPACIFAFDTTYLPRGKFGAGGWLRTEDALRMTTEIAAVRDLPDDAPVIVLMHHHLIPTPVTDVGVIDVHGKPPYMQWVVGKLLPELLANADREELMMTALGAGSALSLLHTIGRAVVVLHGHKHYPNARVLSGVHLGEGDVLLASAGSAGLAESWRPSNQRTAMRLWPSFNVIDLEANGEPVVHVECTWFPHELSMLAQPHPSRPLVAVRRKGARLEVKHVPPPLAFDVRLARNVAKMVLSVEGGTRDTCNLTCIREIEPLSSCAAFTYRERVEGLPGGHVEVFEPAASRAALPHEVALHAPGRSEYRVSRAVSASRASAESMQGPGAAYESVEFVNRYGANLARLELQSEKGAALLDEAFGCLTDLNTGQRRPMPVHRQDDGSVVLEAVKCPARTLLSIYWPLP